MKANEWPQDLPQVRVSEDDRERTRALLKEACVDGRLSLEELGQRIEQVELAQTRDQLREAVLGLDVPLPRTTPATSSTLALMSAVERSGRWRIGEKSRAVVLMGECKLDLRHAAVSAPVTTIQARVVMGNLEVTVPEGVEVELEATTIMGARNFKQTGALPPAGGPVVRITGFVLMGAVTVRVRR